MVLPAQFQLGFELTNIVRPLNNALSTLGSVALVDAVRRSGSDVITEMKLASLLGRHRVDPAIAFHFREMVAISNQSFISRYVDILLESGAGPTVREALKDPALFSMIIQLSALAFAHEDESLANAVVLAIEHILRDSGAGLERAPDYVALLGTVRACRQQTVAFQWSALFEDVEYKIRKALETPEEDRQRPLRNAKIRRPGTGRLKLKNATNRSLPFAVFQSLLMWLQSLQSFPEHRLLHIKCVTGISTIVVWCHHVLGLNVTVRLQGTEVCFGQGISNLLVEDNETEEASASLLDPADRHVPLFSLSNTEEDPEVGFETRADAFGYGMRILRTVTESDEELQYCSHWIIGRSLLLFRSSPLADSVGKSWSASAQEDWSEQDIVSAGTFFFALDQLNLELLETNIEAPLPGAKQMKAVMDNINWPPLVDILISFARIRDLEACRKLPLSVDVCRQLMKHNHRVEKSSHLSPGPMTDLMGAFTLLSRLLLGHCYFPEYVMPAVLISAWGWSIFFGSFDSVDPADVSRHTLRVMHGVPSRHGVRKERIIDGPTDLRLSRTMSEVLDGQKDVLHFPGISNSKSGPVLVGHHGTDAFSITQTFEWRSNDGSDKRHKLGFREMQEMCMEFTILPSCKCDEVRKEAATWVDSNTLYEELSRQNLYKPSQVLKYLGKWPRHDRNLASTQERVFVKFLIPSIWKSPRTEISNSSGTWFFYVTDNTAARWLQLNELCSFNTKQSFSGAMRPRSCCVGCAAGAVPANENGLTLVLL